MVQKKAAPEVKPAKSTAEPKRVRLAYHAGPPEISFFGRRWLIKMAQTVSQSDYAAMRQRPDFAGFNFIEEEKE